MSALIFAAIFFVFGTYSVPPESLAINHVPKIEAKYEPLRVVRKIRTMDVEASAYSVDEDGGITCLGNSVIAGETLAVDNSVIPYGSIVYFHSTGETYIAGDCGGYIIGNRVDKAMATREECFKYGRRNERVTVYFKETEVK